MGKLVRFEDSVAKVDANIRDAALQPDQNIQWLYQKLISPDFRNSVETKTGIVGEMVYLSYLHSLAIKREE